MNTNTQTTSKTTFSSESIGYALKDVEWKLKEEEKARFASLGELTENIRELNDFLDSLRNHDEFLNHIDKWQKRLYKYKSDINNYLTTKIEDPENLKGKIPQNPWQTISNEIFQIRSKSLGLGYEELQFDTIIQRLGQITTDVSSSSKSLISVINSAPTSNAIKSLQNEKKTTAARKKINESLKNQIGDLQSFRNAILSKYRTLEDLEFEYQKGKVSEVNYKVEIHEIIAEVNSLLATQRFANLAELQEKNFGENTSLTKMKDFINELALQTASALELVSNEILAENIVKKVTDLRSGVKAIGKRISLIPANTSDLELKPYKEAIKTLLSQSGEIIPPDIINTNVDSLTQEELANFALSLDKTINILGSQEILNATVSKGLFEQQAKIDDLMKQTEASRIALAKEINLILGDGHKKDGYARDLVKELDKQREKKLQKLEKAKTKAIQNEEENAERFQQEVEERYAKLISTTTDPKERYKLDKQRKTTLEKLNNDIVSAKVEIENHFDEERKIVAENKRAIEILVARNIDYASLPPMELLAITRLIEEEINFGANSEILKSAENLAKYYTVTRQSDRQFNELQERLGIRHVHKLGNVPPWANLTRREVVDNQIKTFRDWEFSNGNDKAERVAQLISPTSFDKNYATVLTIRENEIAKMKDLKIIDDNGYYSLQRIADLNELKKKDAKSLTAEELATLQVFADIEDELTANVITTEARARLTPSAKANLLAELGRNDLEWLLTRKGEQGLDPNEDIAERMIREMIAQGSRDVGLYMAKVQREITGREDSGKYIEDIVAQTKEGFLPTYLKTQDLASRAHAVAKENVALLMQQNSFKKSYPELQANDLVRDIAEALEVSYTYILESGMIVPPSVTEIKLTGENGQIATMRETILKEGLGATTQIGDIVDGASSTQSMSPDPDDTESPTAIKAKKSVPQKHAEVLVRSFHQAPSPDMMRLAFPEYNNFIVSGIRLDTEEARRHYTEKFDVSSNVGMVSTIASYTSANNLTNYLVSTFKGGDTWLIYKKNKQEQKKSEKQLKFWAAINSIPILGNISEIHDAITELGIILPQQWQSELKSYGSKMYKDGKVNPLLPTLLSVRNGRNEPILTKYAYTLGILSENSNDHFSKVLGNFLGTRDERAKYKGGFSDIPFLTKSVVWIKPKMQIKDESGNLLKDEFGKPLKFKKAYKETVAGPLKKSWSVNQRFTDPLLQSLRLVDYRAVNIGGENVIMRVNVPMNALSNAYHRSFDAVLTRIFDPGTNLPYSQNSVIGTINNGRVQVNKRLKLGDIDNKTKVTKLQGIIINTKTNRRRSTVDIIFRVAIHIVKEVIVETVKEVGKFVDHRFDNVKQYRRLKSYFREASTSSIELSRFALNRLKTSMNLLRVTAGGIAKSLPAGAVGSVAGGYLGSYANPFLAPIFGNNAGTIVGATIGGTLSASAKFSEYMFSPQYKLGGYSRFQKAVMEFNGAEWKMINGKMQFVGKDRLLNIYRSLPDNYFSILSSSGKVINSTSVIHRIREGIDSGTMRLNALGEIESIDRATGKWILHEFSSGESLKLITNAEGIRSLANRSLEFVDGKIVSKGFVSLFDSMRGKWGLVPLGAGLGAAAGTGVAYLINKGFDAVGLGFINLPYAQFAIAGTIIGGTAPIIINWGLPNIANALSPESSFGKYMGRLSRFTQDPASLLIQNKANSFYRWQSALSSAKSGMYVLSSATLLAEIFNWGNPLVTGLVVGTGAFALDYGVRTLVVPRLTAFRAMLAETALAKFGSALVHLPVMDSIGLGWEYIKFNDMFVQPYLTSGLNLKTYLFGGDYTQVKLLNLQDGINMGGLVDVNGKLLTLDEARAQGINLNGARVEYRETRSFQGILRMPWVNLTFLGSAWKILGYQYAIANSSFIFFRTLAEKFPNLRRLQPLIGQQGSSIWGRFVQSRAGQIFVESRPVTFFTRIPAGLSSWGAKATANMGNFGRFARFATGSVWKFIKGVVNAINPLTWNLNSLTMGNLTGGFIGAAIGTAILTALGVPMVPAVIIGATIGGAIFSYIGAGIALAIVSATGPLGFLLSTLILSVSTSIGHVLGGLVGNFIDKTFFAAARAAQASMHALTSLVGIFSLAKAILDGDWSKTIINIMQMSMGAVVVAPVVVTTIVLVPQLITPTTLPMSQLALLPPSLYVTKNVNVGSYDPSVPSIKYTITINPTDGPMLVNLIDDPASTVLIHPISGSGWDFATIDALTNNVVVAGLLNESVSLTYELMLADTLENLSGVCNNLSGTTRTLNDQNATDQSVILSVCTDEYGNPIENTTHPNVVIAGLPMNPYSVTTMASCFEGPGGHHGIDLSTIAGATEEVYAVADGEIVYSGSAYEPNYCIFFQGHPYCGGYGRLIKLRLTTGEYVYYGHLSQEVVSVGDIVRKGDLLGLSNNTGSSAGSHLHLEVRGTDDNVSNQLNPCNLFKTDSGDSICSSYNGGSRCI